MRGSSRKILYAPLLLVTVPLALACGGDDEMGGDAMPGQQSEMQASGQSETVAITEMDGSGVTGEVDFTREGETLEVGVLAYTLGGPGDYPSHIHQGTCNEPGGVVTPLDAAVAHEPGTGEAETEVDATQLEASGSYLVMIHSLQGAPVACAEIPESVLSAS